MGSCSADHPSVPLASDSDQDNMMSDVEEHGSLSPNSVSDEEVSVHTKIIQIPPAVHNKNLPLPANGFIETVVKTTEKEKFTSTQFSLR